MEKIIHVKQVKILRRKSLCKSFNKEFFYYFYCKEQK